MMSPQLRHQHGMFVLWLIVVMIVSGCSGRRIVTAVEDQAFQPGPLPAVASEAEKGAPPPATMAKPPSVETPPSETSPSESLREEVREEEMHVPEQPTVETIPQTALPIPSHPAAELSDIYFDFDQHAIRADAQSGLEANAAILLAQQDRTIVIEGHCDERGTNTYNLVLGERRAQAARRYLQDLGVEASQIQIISYGKEHPFCAEHSEACWQSNRRAHFRQP